MKHEDYTVCALILDENGNEYSSPYTALLKYYPSSSHKKDLIPLTKYDRIKKDEPVICRNENFCKRHFSHEEDGLGYCFCSGGTSFTENTTAFWHEIYTIPEFKEKFPEEAERMGL